jgi:hypothetical protein
MNKLTEICLTCKLYTDCEGRKWQESHGDKIVLCRPINVGIVIDHKRQNVATRNGTALAWFDC